MKSTDITLEIDVTLDRLIQNAETLQQSDWSELSTEEFDAFAHTQDSLLHHFLRLDAALETQRVTHTASYRIRTKTDRFYALKQSYQPRLNEQRRRRVSMVSKRRSKRWLGLHQ
ncbi:MAG: hypothetical protein RL235_943 [Chlamydiota bacterium]|jgi:hypothetical protein